FFYYFFFKTYSNHQNLHTFPTRRSSDLRRLADEKSDKNFVQTFWIFSFSSSRPLLDIRYHNTVWHPHHFVVTYLGQRSDEGAIQDRKSTRLNSSHVAISYAVFCLKKKNK